VSRGAVADVLRDEVEVIQETSRNVKKPSKRHGSKFHASQTDESRSLVFARVQPLRLLPVTVSESDMWNRLTSDPRLNQHVITLSS